MKARWRTALITFFHAVGGFVFLYSVSSLADSWLPPREFDTSSENGKFVGRVIPGKTSKPQLIVSSKETRKTNELWRTELSNDVSPTQVWVSDDGKSVVTSDNWGRVGYGDDVVAIYNKGGLLAKYSLEQIAPPSKPKKGVSDWFSDRQFYEKKFSHSTSSRHWRRNSIEFFFQEPDQLLFCLWLDWDNRWVVWRMTDGKMINVTADQVQKLNVEGRNRALTQAKTGRSVEAALNFLGRLRLKEDRHFVEAWLQNAEFSTGSMQSSSSGNPEMIFAFTARSYKREAADKILSRWDGKASSAGLGSLDEYQFLGILKCVVVFTTPPAKKDGTIRLYLIPQGTPLNEWASINPTQYAFANLDHSYPYIFDGRKSRDGHLSNAVNFIIYGVTPGKYRLKAVWDKAAPFAEENKIVYRTQTGDYESTTSPVISIRKGATTDGVRIECDKLIK